MIPRLFEGNAQSFDTLGITPLTDCIECTVNEERNGVFELSMTIATTTPYFSELKEGRLIVAKPNHTQEPQAFEIYKITKPINQKVTVLANHISYRQSFVPVAPFQATGITATLNGLMTNSLEQSDFGFETDITNETSEYNQIAPASLRSRLGGTEGSLLDVFGGEFLWDNYTTHLLLHRGADNGVELRVGKNITALSQVIDLDSVVTGVLPYWHNMDNTVQFYGDIQYSTYVQDFPYNRTIVLDLSQDFEETPTRSQLNIQGAKYLQNASLGTPKNTVTLSFVDLADTDEYKNSVLERVNLCDTVSVIYPPLNINYKAKCVRVLYDVLRDRTIEIDVGNAKTTITQTIEDLSNEVASQNVSSKMVSVVQTIDYEVGQATSTLADRIETVNDDLGAKISGNTSQIQQNTNAISTKVTAEQVDNIIGGKGYVTSSDVEQTAEGLRVDINKIVTDYNLEGVAETTEKVNKYFDFGTNGLTIGSDNSPIKAEYDNDGLQFVSSDGNIVYGAFSVSDGLVADKLAVGSYSTKTNRWNIITSSDGSHLRFTRHS